MSAAPNHALAVFSSPIHRNAFLRWAALIGVVVAWKMLDPSSDAGNLGFAAALLVLVVSAFFWPSCPHCGARVVQFNKIEWIPGKVCWRCGQVYDEDNDSLEELGFEKLAEQAYKLRKKDPETSERLFREAEAGFQRVEEQRRTRLRSRVAVDPSAARKLRRRLLDELKFVEKSLKQLGKEAAETPELLARIQPLRQRQGVLRTEIAALGE